jgi:4-hydroxy-tetrahydrodipicolinate reductase
MSLGEENPHDRIVVEGDPPLDVTIAGGTHGDRATVGTVVNLVSRIGGLGRGLVTAATSYR